MTLYFGDILPYIPALLKALAQSLYVTIFAMLVGSAVGVLLYLGKAGSVRVIRVVSQTYIEVFRNTPLLVQLFLIYFGSSKLGVNLDPLGAALVGLTLNNGAYTAEIYRAGFESVPKGLKEAGGALGLRPRQVFLHVVFVPATRNVFPALTNQFILLFLASSIASIIGLPELMNTILNINAETYRTFEVLTAGGSLYLVTSILLASISRLGEARLFRWAVKPNG